MAFLLKKTGLTTGRAKNQHFPWPWQAGECVSAAKAQLDVLSLCPRQMCCSHHRWSWAEDHVALCWEHAFPRATPLAMYGNMLLVPASRS